MRATRVVLLFFLVLFTSAGVAALVNPLPRPPATGTTGVTSTGSSNSTTGELPEADAGPEGEPVEPDPPEVAQIELGVTDDGGEAARGSEQTRLESGRRVVVTVSSSAPGEITLNGLGRVDSVNPGTPAVFDLLPDRAGEFEVRFEPAGKGRPRRIGVLLVSD